MTRTIDPDISHDEVIARFHYDPMSGVVTRKTRGGGKGTNIGDVVGHPVAGGMATRIGYHRVRLHRLIWFYMTKEWPPAVVDHINRDWKDNRWANLRACTQSENRRNNSVPRHNTSGIIGVLRCRDKWRAQITMGDKTIHIGVFESKESAAAARDAYARNAWGEFAPGAVSS